MRHVMILVAIICCTRVLDGQDAQPFALPPSRAPFVYIIDYSAKHLGNEPWFEAAAFCKPDLLHLGKDVPFTHNWGPIAGWGGENQYCGTTPEEKKAYQRRLSPAEVREKIKTIKAMVDRLHASGVDKVMPYVGAMTIAGDWERRTGLWDLYDHWDEYAEFGLGPKPKDDPKDWLIRKSDGTVFGYYAPPQKLYPPYGTERRCAACMNHPGWRQYMKAVMEWTAKCGYGGVFPDNACMFLCECPRCQGMFREFLKSRYRAEDRTRLFGSEDLAEVKLSSEHGTLLSAESKRFWCAGIADFMEFLRRSAQAIRPGFKIFPNAGAARWVEHAVSDCDLMMYELHGKHGLGSVPGVVHKHIVEEIGVESYINNEFEHKFARAVGRRVRAIGLVRGGSEAISRKTADSSWLPLAEAAAYGGGGSASGLRMTTDPVQSAPVIAYREFFEKWKDLSEGCRPFARIGIATFSDQDFYVKLGWLSHGEHLVSARHLSTQLAEAHLSRDFVVRRAFTPEYIKQFRAVVLTKATYMDQPEIDAARAYTENGGVLVLIGDNGMHNYRVEKREQRPFADFETGEPMAACPGVRVKTVDQGKVVFFESEPAEGELAKAYLSLVPDDRPLLVGENSTRTERIHFETMVRTDGNAARIVLHAINYNVRLGKDAPPTEMVEGLKVSIPLPPGFSAKAARSASPEQIEAVDVPFAKGKDCIECEMPPVKFYRVLAVDLQKE